MATSPTRRKRFLPILGVLLLVAVLAFLAWYHTSEPGRLLQAEHLLGQGSYESAISLAEQLPESEQAQALILEARYLLACEYMEGSDFTAAIALLEELGTYEDSARRLQSCYYSRASHLRGLGDLSAAHSYYTRAGSFRDAATQAQYMLYLQGHNAFLQGDYTTARSFFDQLEGSEEDHGYLHFESMTEATAYFAAQRQALAENISIYIPTSDEKTLLQTVSNVFTVRSYTPNYDSQEQLLTLARIYYYPGDTILTAHRTGTTDALTPEEQETLELALEVIAQGQAETDSAWELELWLHDWLCDRVTYESPNMEVSQQEFLQLRQLTCVGAIVDGSANCQGYADAFYLLGNLAGLEVERVRGEAEMGHVWNTVTLDGTRYLVDTTFDDLSDDGVDAWNYAFFNIYWDPDTYDPYGDDAAGSVATTEKDLSQTYYHKNDLIATDLNAAAKSLVKQKMRGGKKWAYILLRDEVTDQDALGRAIKRVLQDYYGSFSWTQFLEVYDGSTYIAVHWQ